MGDSTATATPSSKMRRALRFNSIDEAQAEVDRLAAIERSNKLQHTGNWELGQALGHLAAWANFAYDGYPDSLKAPWIVKFFGRMFKSRFLNKGLPAGARIPKIKGGTLAIDLLSLEEGETRFREAFARLKSTPTTMPNIILGPMTYEEWIKLNLRHCELHLSFFYIK
jgi:hypothetical protein